MPCLHFSGRDSGEFDYTKIMFSIHNKSVWLPENVNNVRDIYTSCFLNEQICSQIWTYLYISAVSIIGYPCFKAILTDREVPPTSSLEHWYTPRPKTGMKFPSFNGYLNFSVKSSIHSFAIFRPSKSHAFCARMIRAGFGSADYTRRPPREDPMHETQGAQALICVSVVYFSVYLF